VTVSELNLLSKADAKDAFERCCGSTNWVLGMVAGLPYESIEQVMAAAHACWSRCSVEDGLEAFKHHPKIGSIDALAAKFASTSKWASGEQASVKQASMDTIQALADGNNAYEAKFGYIFIVCATGKSAEEMLQILQSRLPHTPDEEIKIAMAEQMKITEIRLHKLLEA
jgi:2-oxo-4-hydroxy-4-carboxy-5-ureidoimidazoline decarboxylase